MNGKRKVLGAIVFCALACTSQASATEILTTSFNAWKGTTNGTYSEWTYSPNPANNSYSTASGYNLSTASAGFGTTVVTGPDGGGYILNGNAQYGGGQALQSASDGVGSMVFTTQASGLTAFLFGIGVSGNTSPVTVILSDGETFTANPAVNGVVLLGLSSGTPITSFTLSTAAGSAVDLTDFFAGNTNQAAAAPAAEVTTALMIGTGLLFFGARRKVFSNFWRTPSATRAVSASLISN